MSKLKGIKAGDRVRVTFEGVVIQINPVLKISPDGCRPSGIWYPDGEENTSTFQITRIEPPLKVGDRVVWGIEKAFCYGIVVAKLSDGRLVVENQAGDTTNVIARDPSCFTRA